MKMKVRSVAFAMLLAPAILFADSINVTFDAALTNMTEWAYSDIATNKDGNIYFKLSSSVQSPTFPFAITSIEITLSCSSTAPSRHLLVIPSSGEATSAASVAKANTKETQFFEFDKTDAVRSFSMAINGGGSTGNWYIYSAAIFGVPLIEAPTNLQADDSKGTRCRLSWANPVNAVSNKIEVSEVVRKVVYGTMLDEYDFMALTNNNTNASLCLDKNNLQMDYYPAFSGTNIYAAGNSTGVVQISSRENRGSLKYDLSAIKATLDESADISLLVSAKRHSSDTSGTYGLKITVVDANDNSISCITNNLVYEFPEGPVVVPLQEASSGTSVILEPSDTAKTNRRILIDYLAFIRDYSPASVSTNLVKTVFTTGNAATIRGLSPNSSYVVSATAFDADGNESKQSELISFMTGSEELPFIIRLQ